MWEEVEEKDEDEDENESEEDEGMSLDYEWRGYGRRAENRRTRIMRNKHRKTWWNNMR